MPVITASVEHIREARKLLYEDTRPDKINVQAILRIAQALADRDAALDAAPGTAAGRTERGLGATQGSERDSDTPETTLGRNGTIQ